MSVCVPIRELKNTASFAELVNEADDTVIVTKNGQAAFAVLTMEQLDALKMEAARAHLYELVDEAERDFANDDVMSARDSQSRARSKYGL